MGKGGSGASGGGRNVPYVDGSVLHFSKLKTHQAVTYDTCILLPIKISSIKKGKKVLALVLTT